MISLFKTLRFSKTGIASLIIFSFMFSLLSCKQSTSDNSKKGSIPERISQSPEWAKDAIWYQIFPDRFRNGDTSNDPDVASLTGTWPYANPEGWQISPWTSDWYKMQPWEVATGEDFWYNAQLRRYGGDLQGIIDKLDYIEELGVNAIYMNPIFESPSLHKYGCSMWHHVDNNFGPDPAGDEAQWGTEDPGDPSTWTWTSADSLFLELLDLAHSKNIRVIIDGVFNHTGIPFWAFDDIRINGSESKYADWFTILSYDDPNTDEDELDWQGWYGVKDLPELAEDEHGPNDEVKDHLKAVVKRWMDPNGDGDPSDGIDGWRLDVAEMVSKDFWREFRTWCREVNPESYLVGEVWWENFQENQMIDATDWLKGDIFDAVMNYRMGDALLRGMVDKELHISAGEMDSLLAIVRDNYREQNQYVLMSMYNSHDTERIASMVTNPDRAIDHDASSRDHKSFYLGPPNDAQRALQRALLLFQFSYVGAPLVYYGDEVGMWGADDPDCRKPMVWADMDFDNEIVKPYDESFGPFEVSINVSLYKYYKSLIQMRKTEPALRQGSYETVLAKDDHYVFMRSLQEDILLAVFNTGETEWTPDKSMFGDIGEKGWEILIDSNASGSDNIAEHSGRVYKLLK
mgnify:CR=1 FL=1